MDLTWTEKSPTSKSHIPPSPRRHSINQSLYSLEAGPIKHSIPEEKADNFASKLSEVMLEYFPKLDPKMVSQVATKCVQDRVQITEQVEMVFSICTYYLINRTPVSKQKRKKNNLRDLNLLQLSFLFTSCANAKIDDVSVRQVGTNFVEGPVRTGPEHLSIDPNLGMRNQRHAGEQHRTPDRGNTEGVDRQPIGSEYSSRFMNSVSGSFASGTNINAKETSGADSLISGPPSLKKRLNTGSKFQCDNCRKYKRGAKVSVAFSERLIEVRSFRPWDPQQSM